MNENIITNGIRVAMIIVFTIIGVSFIGAGCEPVLSGGDDLASLEIFFGFVLIGFAYLFFLIGEKGRNWIVFRLDFHTVMSGAE